MFSIETIKRMNDKESLRLYMEDNPLLEIKEKNISDSLKGSPDYSKVDIDLLEIVTHLKLQETYFIDSSGFERPNESSSTFSNFLDKIKKYRREVSGEVFCCLTEIGKFQVSISVFK